MVTHAIATRASREGFIDDEHRHWCPVSEKYAPADVLLDYLRQGWELDKLVAVETFYFAGYRCSDIYYFTLYRDDLSCEMPVLANPIVLRVVEEQQLSILRINVAPLE
ncbi:MAG: hypothetical protein IT324_05675 [Anaerolineae bacterium]|nr:hypothetical protein [Anaerolineae bacterium]